MVNMVMMVNTVLNSECNDGKYNDNDDDADDGGGDDDYDDEDDDDDDDGDQPGQTGST